MIPSAIALRESLPFSLSLRAIASWMPVSTISSVSDMFPQLAQVGRWIGLDVGVEEVAHVRLVGLDVQLLARVPLDRGAQIAVELDFFLQGRRIGVGIARLGKVLRDGGEGTNESRHRLVERHPQRLGLVQRIGVGGVPAEIVQVLLHLARQGHGLAQIAQRLAGLVELLLSFLQPVLEVDVVVAAVALVGVQLVGAVDGDGLLHVAEQLLEVHDVAVVLVVAVEPVGAADGLEQVVIAQLVVEVDIGAARRVEAGEQLTHHDQQLQVRRFLDEAALGLVLVLLRGLAVLEDVLGVGVELVAFVAVGRLARDGVVVRLVGRDDPAVGAESSCSGTAGSSGRRHRSRPPPGSPYRGRC